MSQALQGGELRSKAFSSKNKARVSILNVLGGMVRLRTFNRGFGAAPGGVCQKSVDLATVESLGKPNVAERVNLE